MTVFVLVGMRLMLVRCRRFVRMCVPIRAPVAGEHIHFGGCYSTAGYLARFQAGAHIERMCRLLQKAEWDAGIDQGAEQHVAANA